MQTDDAFLDLARAGVRPPFIGIFPGIAIVLTIFGLGLVPGGFSLLDQAQHSSDIQAHGERVSGAVIGARDHRQAFETRSGRTDYTYTSTIQVRTADGRVVVEYPDKNPYTTGDDVDVALDPTAPGHGEIVGKPTTVWWGAAACWFLALVLWYFGWRMWAQHRRWQLLAAAPEFGSGAAFTVPARSTREQLTYPLIVGVCALLVTLLSALAR